MQLTPIQFDSPAYPSEFHALLADAALYDSSCSPEARVIFINKDGGYFLKRAPKGTLKRQAAMTKYFHSKGLTSQVLAYLSAEEDWLLMEKVQGDDCIAEKYLQKPEKLCDILAEQLATLHSLDFADCPVQNHTERHLATAERNKQKNHEAWAVVETHGHLLQNNTLLHGDYCLPNIMLDDWRFAGFIDLDHAGVGDRHVDLFWGIWSLGYNLKTQKYRQRFIDAYGRDNVDEDMLRIVAAIEVFG